MSFDLEEFLEECKKDFGCQLVTGGRWGGKHYRIEIGQRYDFFIYLLNQFKEKGKDRFYLIPNKETIIKSCIPKGKKYEDKKGGWYQSTLADFNKAIPNVFPTQENKNETKHEPITETESTPTNNTVSAKEKMLKDCDDSEHDWSAAPVWDPKKYQQETGEPPLGDIIDPEMAELLGYNRKK